MNYEPQNEKVPLNGDTSTGAPHLVSRVNSVLHMAYCVKITLLIQSLGTKVFLDKNICVVHELGQKISLNTLILKNIYFYQIDSTSRLEIA